MVDQPKKTGLIGSALEHAGKSPEQQTMLSALAALAAGAPFPITNQWYHLQNLSIDGYRFVKCHFDSCELYMAKGTFAFERCKFTNCKFIFDKEAYNVVQTYNILTTEAWTNWPSLAPIVHEDGTFTLRRAG